MIKYLVSLILLLSFFQISYSQIDNFNYSNEKYNWDLTRIYSSWDKWDDDFNLLKTSILYLNEYRGKLDKSPETLLEFKKAQNSILKLKDKLFFYVYLSNDLDSRNGISKSKLKELQFLSAEFEKELAWVKQELNNIPQETVFRWMNENNELNSYRYDFIKLYDQQSHVVDSRTQEIKSNYNQVTNSILAIFDALSLSDMNYNKATLSNGEKIVANPSNSSKVYVNEKNQNDRKLVFEALEESYSRFKNTYTEIWIGVAQNVWAEAKIHGYETCLEYVLEPENISTDIYLNLIEVASNNTKVLEKYRELRKTALGLDLYYGSDELIELVEVENEYPFNQAVEIVKESLKLLGKDYSKKLEDVFQGGWIDVYSRPGKYAAAYNLSTYGVQPYILLNWNNTRSSLFTLSHETGHAIHSVYSNEYQPYQYSSYSTLIAETASQFNEMMLLDYLIDNLENSNEKIAFLVQSIDNISKAFYRQTQFAEFEYELFSMLEKGIPLNTDVVAEKFEQIDKKYNGNIITRSENYPYSWPKIHHFCSSPYYVYNYAVSFSCSSSLFNQIKQAKTPEDAKKAQEKYLTLLKSGGSDYPVDLLKRAGVDLTTKEPYLAVVNRMTELVDQLEVALKEVGKI